MFIYGQTDKGLVREKNEDALFFEKISEKLAFAIVCDGMGGRAGGEIASNKAIEFISTNLKNNLHTIAKNVKEDDSYVVFSEEVENCELSSKDNLKSTSKKLKYMAFIMQETSKLLQQMEKPKMAETAKTLSIYINSKLVPFYSEFADAVGNAFNRFNEHRRGYAVAVKDIPLESLTKKVVNIDIKADKIQWEDAIYK